MQHPIYFEIDTSSLMMHLQTAQDNIDLQTTILSRFDLIFIVKDVRLYDQDKVWPDDLWRGLFFEGRIWYLAKLVKIARGLIQWSVSSLLLVILSKSMQMQEPRLKIQMLRIEKIGLKGKHSMVVNNFQFYDLILFFQVQAYGRYIYRNLEVYKETMFYRALICYEHVP